MNNITRILYSSLLAMFLATILAIVTSNRMVTTVGTFIIVFFSVLLFSKKRTEK